MSVAPLGGQFTFPGTSLTVHRMGYGAMQLAGPGVWGPPRDPDGAVAVLREAVAAGVNHIDTSDYYGPHVTNQIIREALHPYPEGLVIVTKLGGRRPPDKSWQPAFSPQELTAGRPRQSPQPGPGRARHRQLPRDGVGPRPRGGVHRRAGDGAGRTQAQGPDPPHRPEQRHGRPGRRGAGDHRHRVRAEQLQPGPPRRRRADRRPGPAGHRLRAVFPARRVHAAAVVHAVGRRGSTRGQADAGRAGVAAAPIAEHSA